MDSHIALEKGLESMRTTSTTPLHYRDWEAKIDHCYREANPVADHLANIGATGVDQKSAMIVYACPPNSVLNKLFEDIYGAFCPRVISNE